MRIKSKGRRKRKGGDGIGWDGMGKDAKGWGGMGRDAKG